MKVELLGYQDGRDNVRIQEDGSWFVYSRPENVLKTGEKGHIITYKIIPEITLEEIASNNRVYPIHQHHRVLIDRGHYQPYPFDDNWYISNSIFNFDTKEYKEPTDVILVYGTVKEEYDWMEDK